MDGHRESWLIDWLIVVQLHLSYIHDESMFANTKAYKTKCVAGVGLVLE